MSPDVRAAMIWLSEATLALNFIFLNVLAVYAWIARQRDGALMRAYAWERIALAFFFNFFTFIWWDRHFNIWPWADLGALMGREFYWIPRLVLTAGCYHMLIALVRTRR